MRSGQASRSAMGSALLRAADVREDPAPHVLEDTLSARLVPAAERARLEAVMAGWPPAVRRAMRLGHAVRQRVAEDAAVAVLDDGRPGYVLLGAGLDTFALRHPRAAGFRVLEIDHPDTQAWKRAALRRAGLPQPLNVRHLPADLAADGLAGQELPRAATWSRLGVTMYLPPQAVLDTLRAVAAAGGPGTALVADFVDAGAPDTAARAVQAAAGAAVAADREPILGVCTAARAERMLRGAGFTGVTVLDAAALTARHLAGRPELRLSSATFTVVATR